MTRRADPERIYVARRAAVFAKLATQAPSTSSKPSIGSRRGNDGPSGKVSTG